jgi:colanic acid/amylovoran biosynthesis glycosyltransferase
MRIAYVIPVFPEIHNTFVLNQITGMIDRGHEVDLYPLALGDFEQGPSDVRAYALRNRVRHIRVPANRLERAGRAAQRMLQPRFWRRSVFDALDPRRGGRTWSLVPLYTALSFASHGRYDVIHVQFGHLGPLIARLAVTGGVEAPIVTSFRGADATSHLPRNLPGYRELFRVGASFLPVSDALRARIVESGAPSERTVVHHSGIDLARFPFEARRRDHGEPTRFLFVGRLVEKKGVSFALEAFAKVLVSAEGAEITEDLAPPPRRRDTPQRGPVASFEVIGSGPMREELEARAQRLGVSDSVRFLGERSHEEVAIAMRRAHVLVAPSVTAESGDQEGIPNVLKEAMASGMPVIGTLHGGIPELVEDGVSGYLVPERDVGMLAERMRTLAMDPRSWAAQGAAGRAKVEGAFDANVLNDRLAERYLQAREWWLTNRR